MTITNTVYTTSIRLNIRLNTAVKTKLIRHLIYALPGRLSSYSFSNKERRLYLEYEAKTNDAGHELTQALRFVEACLFEEFPLLNVATEGELYR